MPDFDIAIGRIVHFKALARELPAIITDVLDREGGIVNLVVFTDGRGSEGEPTVHSINVNRGDAAGQWHPFPDCKE